jgi:hypothetical protein
MCVLVLQNWDFTFTADVLDFYVHQRNFSFTVLPSVAAVVNAVVPLLRSLDASAIAGIVVFDPNVRVSLPIAFTLSGLDNAIVTSPR